MAMQMKTQQSAWIDFLQVVIGVGLFSVVFLPLVVWNGSFFPFITGKNFLFRGITEIVFACWVVLALYDAKYRPQFSWVVAMFVALLGVMLVANAFGEYPLKSFWSNFERMEGYVTWVHVGMYLIVAGSFLNTEKWWTYFLNTSIVVALLVALYGLGQQAGIFEGGGGDRVDSRLGNAAYMAVYMLFHIFFIALLSLRTKVKWQWAVYGVFALIMTYTLLQTGTRGAFIGVVGGVLVAVGYMALFARRMPELRKVAIGGMIAVVFLAGLFINMRDSELVQNNSALRRIANIDLQEDLQVRSVIWGMAWEGFKERPLLGWGQGNFNYVFNTQYEPFLYDQEQWFDRVHNLFFDWLIAGGILGTTAYFGILLAVVYYIFIVPVFLRRESPFSVPEQAILLGLLVAYGLHNMVVFDNIISLIFFGTLLAFVHQRVAVPIPALMEKKISLPTITQIAIPIMFAVVPVVVYMVNASGFLVSRDLIHAMRAETVRDRLAEFHQALERGSFARQEVVEQLAQNAMAIARNQNISTEERQLIVQRAELELLALAEDKPGDARVHNFIASFYRTIGQLNQSREQAEIATSLSPRKPSLIMEQGLIELQAEDLASAKSFFREALDLDERNELGRIFLGATMMRLGEIDEAIALIGEDHKEAFAMNDYALASTDVAGANAYLAELYEIKVANEPEVAQHRASLSFLYYQQGDTEKAIAVLEKAGEDIPSFSTRSSCYVNNLREDNDPAEGC